MNGADSPSLSEQAAECRQLAQVAIDLSEIGRLLRMADEFDEKAERLKRQREVP